MGQHAHFLCARDRVQPPLGRRVSVKPGLWTGPWTEIWTGFWTDT